MEYSIPPNSQMFLVEMVVMMVVAWSVFEVFFLKSYATVRNTHYDVAGNIKSVLHVALTMAALRWLSLSSTLLITISYFIQDFIALFMKGGWDVNASMMVHHVFASLLCCVGYTLSDMRPLHAITVAFLKVELSSPILSLYYIIKAYRIGTDWVHSLLVVVFLVVFTKVRILDLWRPCLAAFDAYPSTAVLTVPLYCLQVYWHALIVRKASRAVLGAGARRRDG